MGMVVGLAACQTTGETKVLDGFKMPPLPMSSPREMMGKDGAALRSALGKPALLRQESPAQVWQYQGASCVLDFFLYEEDGGKMRVTHIESRGRNGGGVRPDLCLQDVHRTRYLSANSGGQAGV
jgi:hypothetical protein